MRDKEKSKFMLGLGDEAFYLDGEKVSKSCKHSGVLSVNENVSATYKDRCVRAKTQLIS
jgi:hypothetical protein